MNLVNTSYKASFAESTAFAGHASYQAPRLPVQTAALATLPAGSQASLSTAPPCKSPQTKPKLDPAQQAVVDKTAVQLHSAFRNGDLPKVKSLLRATHDKLKPAVAFAFDGIASKANRVIFAPPVDKRTLVQRIEQLFPAGSEKQALLSKIKSTC